jgi:hypothetical protein
VNDALEEMRREMMMIELKERLERVFEQRALPRVEDAKMVRMTLGELLYYALVEMDDRGLMSQGAMQA